jgi:predicted Zn finger-like uncharacterized protein
MAQAITIGCPRCGAGIAVTDEYLATYGGQVTACPTCREAFTIPLGLDAASPVAPPMLAYAGPHRPAGAEPFRDAGGLVMAKGSVGPDRCVKCNAPAEGYRWSKTFYWHHPALYVMILFPGLLIYAIVALCVRKSGKVAVGLCPAHRAVRRQRLWIGWGLFVLGAAIMIGGTVIGSGMRGPDAESWMAAGLVGGIVILLASGIYAAVAVPVVLPRRIDNQYVYLKRAGEPFLQTVPDLR